VIETKHLARALQIKSLTEDGTFSGYASVFGVEDLGGDIVQRGAFTRSLADHAAKGTMPALLWQHDSRQPIGKFTTVREDATGLYVEGQLALKTAKGAEAYELLKMGALDGMSIGYMTVKYTYDEKLDVMTLIDIDLWEASLVTFPMNESARVGSVKAASIATIRQFEDFLRDEGGFSHAAAKSIAAGGFKAKSDPRDEDGGLAELVAAVKRRGTAIATLSTSLTR
jgi:HK97 family phage prohead protease